MPDDLEVSGSGSVAVASDELYASAQLLHQLAKEASALHHQLGAIDRALPASWIPEAGRAELDIDQAIIVMFEIQGIASGMDWALGTVADGYGFVERFVGFLVGQVTGDLGGLLGRVAPAMLTSTIGGAATLGALAGFQVGGSGLGRAIASSPRRSGIPEGSAFAREHNEIVTNPAMVSLIRAAADGAGSAALAATHIPEPVAAAVGLSGLSIVAGVAGRVGAPVGVLSETPVRLHSSHELPVTNAPSGYAERLARVPVAESGPQVVIERYTLPDGPDRFEVYITGTVDFSPVARDDPWDMTSNFSNAIDGRGGAYASVAEAMRQAGVEPYSPVQFTGYSQGGAVAARLAASGDYDTQGLLSFGGPTGQVPIPGGFPTVLVEHADDPVPALGGSQDNADAVIVRRDVFGGTEIPETYAVPAHHLEYYARTAQLMDEARSEQVAGTLEQLDGFTAGATLESSTAYRFERVGSDELSATSGGR